MFIHLIRSLVCCYILSRKEHTANKKSGQTIRPESFLSKTTTENAVKAEHVQELMNTNNEQQQHERKSRKHLKTKESILVASTYCLVLNRYG